MRVFQALQFAGSGAAPTTDDEGNVNGMPVGICLSDLRAIRVSLLPAKGQTIAADQQPVMYAWLFHNTLKRWIRAQDYDFSMNNGGDVSNGGANHREVLVDDGSVLYFSPAPVTLEGTADAGPSEQDKLVIRIEGMQRRE